MVETLVYLGEFPSILIVSTSGKKKRKKKPEYLSGQGFTFSHLTEDHKYVHTDDDNNHHFPLKPCWEG